MNVHPLKIGGLTTPNNILLAPLAGYTNAVFRRMCARLGAGLTFTEMVSAKGLCYDNEKTKDLLFVTPDYDGVKACQLFGSDPEIMRRAAESVHLASFDLIDINMGCPMPKIYNNGEGSALMAKPELAAKIISACKKSGKNVSVKFRVGLEKGKIIAAEFAKVCEGAGADLITVHGRTRDKIYAGEVDCAAIAMAKSAVKIPVIANGGVFCKADADRLLNETGADGVCVARGAMFSPWIFAELCGNPKPDVKRLVLNQIDDTFELFGERFACVFMRKMCAFYIKGLSGAAALRTRLFACASVEELKETVSNIEF